MWCVLAFKKSRPHACGRKKQTARANFIFEYSLLEATSKMNAGALLRQEMAEQPGHGYSFS
jgi:hypothetical protein